MKKSIAILSLVLLAAACAEKSKEQKMEALRAQITEKKNAAADLKTEIEKLNRELDSLGGKLIVAGTPVEEVILVAAPFNNYLEVMGKVDAEENVNVSSEMPGTVSRINVKPGDVVNKGSVLAETDSKALQQSISDLQTNMELVNTLYDKQKSLWDQKIGTEVQFLQIKNQKESLEKKLAALKEQLNMTKLISPIDEIKLSLKSSELCDIIENYKSKDPIEKYIIDLLCRKESDVMDLISDNYFNNILNNISFIINNPFTIDNKIFDIIYNDKYDEDLLMIIGGMFNSESYHSHSEIQIKLFNHLINKGCPLTEKAFKLYCKYCNCVIIEIFLENKFKPTDDIFLQVNFDNTTHILSFSLITFQGKNGIIPISTIVPSSPSL